MTLTLRGGGASGAGDLVWTHGEAGWTRRVKNPSRGTICMSGKGDPKGGV
jgi:hypothetical protein